MSKAIVNTLESLETGDSFDVRDIAKLSAGYQRQKTQIFQDVVRSYAEAGITVVSGSFEEGAVVTSANEGVWYQADGKVYSWFTDATITVPAGTTPQNFGGVNATAWVDRTDATLRSEISAIDGAGLIGAMSYAQLRAYSGPQTTVNVWGISNFFDGAAGQFKVDASDTTSADDGGTIIVDALGRRWKRQYHGMILIGWFGAKGDGVTDDSAAFTLAINSGKLVAVPKAVYIVSNLEIPENKPAFLVGFGNPILKAKAGSTYVIKNNKNVTRSGQGVVSGFIVDGAGVSGITGIQNGTTAGATLYQTFREMLVKGCYIGISNYSTMENSFYSCTVTGNTVGVYVDQDPINGGGNANTFVECHVQANIVGVVINGSSPYPLHNNIFLGGTIQSNEVCGVALIDADTIRFVGTHIEKNGWKGTASLVFDGLTIPRSAIYADGSNFSLNDLDVSETLSPAIILSGGSSVTLNSASGYGSSTGTFVSGGSTETAIITGSTAMTGVFDCNVVMDSGFNNVGGGKVGWWSNAAPVYLDSRFPNVFKDFPLTPTMKNVVTAVANGATADPTFGLVSSTTFAAVTGSTSSNRITIETVPTASWVSGNYYAISLSVRADKPGRFQFTVATGAYILLNVDLDTTWKRITLFFKASSSVGNLLYVFPLDANGATLYATRVQTTTSPTLNSQDLTATFRGMVGEGFDDNTRHSAAPTTGTWRRGDKVKHSAPVAGGNEGWICVESGSPGTWKTFGVIGA